MKITSAFGYSTQQNYHSKLTEQQKTFHNKQILKQYMTTKPSLQKILQGILHTEDESKQNHGEWDVSNHKPQGNKRQLIRE
jgi:hypothetical protein